MPARWMPEHARPKEAYAYIKRQHGGMFQNYLPESKFTSFMPFAGLMMVLDNLRLLLGDVARFRASFLPQPLLGWESFPFLALRLRVDEQEVDLIMRIVDNPTGIHGETHGRR